MQQLVQRLRVHPLHRFGLVDQPFARHVHRDLEAGGRRALPVARLQHIQLVLLDGEFDVLHVAIVLLERRAHLHQLGVGRGHGVFHAALIRLRAFLGHRLRRADAGDDILALRVDQVFAVEDVLTGRGIAGEADAGRAILAHIAEDHRLDVHGRAPIGGDVVQAAIGVGARVHPAAEHRADRAPQLGVRILREGLAGNLLHHVLVAGDHAVPVLRRQVGIFADAAVELHMLDDLLEAVVVHIEHDGAEHLDEAAVAVPGEARIAGCGGEPIHRRVVQAEVQHRVHHAGHGDPRAGADGDQQRLVGVAELGTHRLFHQRQRVADLRAQIGGVGVLVGVVVGADLGRHGEAGRHGQADTGHLGQVGALAAEEIAHIRAAFIVAGAEAVDPLGHEVTYS